ncbi:MAG: hypothetical protein OZ921_18505 [Sorangiineae bacterium]|nr:hypothetical protein [Sorangiineae bacterium]
MSRLRGEHAVALGAALALGAVGFLPLFGGPGYEAALAAGLLLPAASAVVAALGALRRREAPIDAVARGAGAGALLALAGLASTWLHGLRAGFCEPLEGTALFALGPGAGAVLGGAVGALAGLAAERRRAPRRWAVGLALAAPLGGVLVSLWRFWSSPMVFAFDPFFGYFAGTLYDTVVDAVPRLLSYRVGTLFTLIALAALAGHLTRDPAGRVCWGMPVRRATTVTGALAVAASLAHSLAGPALGHWSTTHSIERALGRELHSARCDVIYSRAVLLRDAELLGRDCDGHVAALERWLGARGPERVRVFLFASSAEKGWLMGASDTYIAKPWRREVYLQAALYPHPVLGHELAHVLAGSFGAGPLRVSGPLGGLLPDPGRIEGLATAAAPPEDAELGLTEWAKTMQELGLLPPLERVFRLSFLGENSATAYTVAGAFVAWFHDVYGAEALRRWYGDGSLPKPLAALEAEWHASLATVTVSEAARVAARARFERPAVFGRRCPHAIDRLAGRAGAALGALDVTGAADDYRELLALDPHDFGARLGLATCALRSGDATLARRRYDALIADPALGRLLRAVAEQALGDLELSQGRAPAALAAYDAARPALVDEDALRTLDVKRLAVEAPLEEARAAIVALLVGEPRLGSDWAEAAARLEAWSSAAPGDGTADYLLGRNFSNRGRWAEAARHLDLALARPLAEPRVAREALRTRFVVGCAMGALPAARAAYARWRQAPGLTPARRAGGAALAARCGIAP